MFSIQKVFVEDARSQRFEFVKQCSQGNYAKVKLGLMSGEDCNSCDDSGVSAIHAAIVESQFDVVDLLVKNGSKVDSRDKNQMTPLLSCVGRGLLDCVRHLVNHGADKTVSDRIHRNGLYYAVKSGSLGMIRQFINAESCNQQDSVWGWTPLHCAANQGDMNVINLLLNTGSSIFIFSKVHILIVYCTFYTVLYCTQCKHAIISTSAQHLTVITSIPSPALLLSALCRRVGPPNR